MPAHERRDLTNPAHRSDALALIFEGAVAAAELRTAGKPALLYPAEAHACAAFAPGRAAEFAAGRLCARRALSELGVDDFPVVVNSDRSPRWPAGYVGSISHTAGYCCAVVAHDRSFAGIGVDAEIVGRVTPAIQTRICTVFEAAYLAALEPTERARALTLLFSAKEAYFKAQFPLTGRWLDFAAVSIDLTDCGDPTRFAVTPATVSSAPGAVLPSSGRFVVDGEVVVTGIALPRAAPESPFTISDIRSAAAARSVR